MSETEAQGIKIICQNKKAFHNYKIEEKVEAGISLKGTEVKSLRAGKGSLADSYADIHNREVFLHKFHITEYTHGNRQNHEPLRKRKLLLHKHEIEKLSSKTQIRGYTLIPLKAYLKGGRVKIELGLARGKTFSDKRESLKEKESKREVDRAFKKKQKRDY